MSAHQESRIAFRNLVTNATSCIANYQTKCTSKNVTDGGVIMTESEATIIVAFK